MKSKLVIAALVSLLSSAAFAAVAEPEPAPAACDLTFASGKAGKGYANFVKDIQAVCPSLPVCNKESEGGLQNLTLLSAKEADIALVQVDTLQQMLNSDDQLRQLQVVAALHPNLLHILTRANGFDFTNTVEQKKLYVFSEKVTTTSHVDIAKFSDLKGKIVGLVGSASLLVQKLNEVSGHGMQFVDFDTDAKAIEALKQQKVFAVMTMAAWPHGYIKGLKSDSGLKLVPYDLAPVSPYAITKKNYASLGQYGVPFLAAPNVIVSRPFAAGGQNAKNVAAVKACITNNLSKLKDGKFEPGWGEVTDVENAYGLPKFVAPKAVAKGK